MDKIKITNHQVFALTASFITGSAILVVSAPVAGLAKQDAWISMLLSIVFSLLEIGLIYFFWSKYPGITFVEMLKQIFGKWLGSIISIGFEFFCLLSASQIVWYMSNFITIQVMPETPSYIINMIFLITIVIAVLYGLESIVRSYEIFIYFVSILFILSMLLVLPKVRIDNLLPIFERGFTPIVKGSFLLSSFLIFPSILLLMIFPVNANNTAKAKKSFIKGCLWGEFLVFISIIFSILVLGSTITATSQYPVYLLAKEISLGVIFTRLEFIVAAVWILTLLSRGILYFYAGMIGFAQFLGLKDHKKIILPLGLIVLIISGIVYEDSFYYTSWDTYVWPPFAATFGLILPIVMLIAFYIKKISDEEGD